MPVDSAHFCRSLEAAVNAAAKFLNKAVKPVLVGGVKLRPCHAEDAFHEFADSSGTLFNICFHQQGLISFFPNTSAELIALNSLVVKYNQLYPN